MSKVGDELLKSMAQALAYAQGKRVVGARVHRVAVTPVDVRKARKRLGLSQDDFAEAFGVSASTLRKWEQGQRTPTGAAKTLLKIVEREPRAVMRALSRISVAESVVTPRRPRISRAGTPGGRPSPRSLPTRS